MTRWIAILTLVVAAATVACPQREATEQPAADEPTEAVHEQGDAAPAEAAAEEAEPAEADVPVAEDFEDEVESTITADNYQAEIDRIAAEIEAGEAEPAAAP